MGKASREKRRKARRARSAAASPPPKHGPRAGGRPSSAPLDLTGPGSEAARWSPTAAAALGVLVAVAYFPAFLAGFVWDDRVFTGTPLVRDWSGLWRIWFSPSEIENEAHYWPLLYTTFWLEHKLWGYAPAGYHVVNVLLHLANTLLLWRLLARLGLAASGAWFVAAVFAVHPLHVESVAWVMERKDVLSGLFYLAAFSAWVRFVEEPRPKPRRRSYLLALALFVLGLLSKSIVVTLPAALAIWHWWRQGRVTGADWFRLTPFFAVGLAVAVADVAFSSTREPISLGYSMIRADAHRGARPVVLRRQAGMAGRARRHLSALGGGRRGPARLGLRHRRRGGGGGALAAPASDRPRAAGRGAVLRGDPVAGARLRGLRLHAVLLRRGPLPVPGRHRVDGGAGGRRRARCAAPLAGGDGGKARCGRRGGRADRPGGADLEAGGDLPGRGDLLQPRHRPQSHGAGRPIATWARR